jgi:glycosyltransferase involved in cell wall biosynthesis
MPLLLAGPVLDEDYVEREIRPRLGDDVRHVGHLDQDALCALVGSARVAVVTPDWEEPYGLVAAEAMACGTPVAALDRGAMREVVVDGGGVLADPHDPAALARAMVEASRLDRDVVRRTAVEHCSLERMVDAYELVYTQALARSRAVA